MLKIPVITRHRATFFRVLLAAALLAISFLTTTSHTLPVAGDINDKVGHVIAFFLLALLVDLSFPAWSFRTKVLVLIAYGLSIEVAQAYLPYRSCSLFDLGADAGGLALYGICQPALRYVPFLGKGPEEHARENP
jgi:VanZ family protein